MNEWVPPEERDSCKRKAVLMNSIREAMEERGYKTYVGEGILIFWNPTKCRHAKECVTGSPAAYWRMLARKVTSSKL